MRDWRRSFGTSPDIRHAAIRKEGVRAIAQRWDHRKGETGMSNRTRSYEWLIVAASLALFLEVPPMVYGYLSYKQFEYLKLTGYMPYEELMIALRSGSMSKTSSGHLSFPSI